MATDYETMSKKKESEIIANITKRAPEEKRFNVPGQQRYAEKLYSFEKERITYNTRVKQFPWIYVDQPVIGTNVQGWGCHEEIGDRFKEMGVTNVYIATTGLKGTGLIEEMESVLKKAGLAYTIGPFTHSNPRTTDIAAGVKAYKDAGCDGVLSVGGGSSHDTGKGIRFEVSNPGKTVEDARAILDPHWMEASKVFNVIEIPQIAVNTTCGTGAEITPFAVMTNWEQRWKYNIMAKYPVGGLEPKLGYNDPAFFRTMPEHIAAQTGIDTMVHGFGGVLSRLGNQAAVAVGMQACKMCYENLPEFATNRWNDVACANMCWAQHLGAMTYALGGGVGMVHAIAHQISAVNDMHHGLANALPMVPVMRYMLPSAAEKQGMIARNAFGLDTTGKSRFQAAEMFCDALERLRNDVGIKDIRLGTYGITEEEAFQMAKHGVNDLNMEGSPRDITEPELYDFIVGLI